MTFLPTLLAAGLVLAPSPTQEARESVGEGWVPLDGVATIINDEIVTESELSRAANQLRESNDVPISTLEELRQFEADVRTRVVLRRLQSQAGRNLGLAEEEVDRLVDAHLDGIRRRLGLLTYIEDLEQRGLAADEVQLQTRRQFYGQTWMDDVVGESKSGKRPRRDRYVRPGEMLHIYRGVREQFGAPEQAELEQFTMAGDEGLDPVEALAEAQALRQRAVAGEDLARLVSEVGPERSATRTLQVPIRNLNIEALREFAASAEPGQISAVLSDRNEQFDRLEYSFFRLLGREEAVAPRPFLDGQVQAVLTDRALAQRDQWYLAEGHRQLVDGSFIEPPLDLSLEP